MTLQLLCRYDAGASQSDHDAGAESRSNAGLSQLQLWREAEGGGLWGLYSVNDRDKAQAWLDGSAKVSGPKVAEAHFLETA